MGKYDVKFNCGHTQTVELFGKEKERWKKIDWLQENSVCSDCYKQQQKEQLEKFEENLPKLEGTAKQIEWARKIRLNNLNKLERNILETINYLNSTTFHIIKFTKKQKEQLTKEGKKLLENLKNSNSAKVWIEEVENKGYKITIKQFMGKILESETGIYKL